MSYGRFTYHVKDLDFWKNHVRLTVGSLEGNDDVFVLLDAKEAQQLVNDIYNLVDDHRESAAFRHGIPVGG